jgi:ubiquinone/menaquinone biosynthesis C-methylase UbiE
LTKPEIHAADYERQRAMWDALAKLDPMWTILSVPDKVGNRWDDREFFATGEREIAAVMDFMMSSGASVSTRRALDFGCGIGRLTRGLASRFQSCVGFDISRIMIQLAAERNADLPNCEWLVNERDDLSPFETNGFSFVYSNIVLQHLLPPVAERYIAEFLRVLEPAGIAVFQLPDERPKTLRRRIREAVMPLSFTLPRPLVNAYRRLRYTPQEQSTLCNLPERVAEMHGAKPERVAALVGQAGGEIVARDETDDAGPGWRSFRYCVRKAEAYSKN